MSENSAMAQTMEVRRADATVGLTFTVAAEELMQIDPREDLTVYAIFPSPSQADSFAGSIQRAAQDAATTPTEEEQMEAHETVTEEQRHRSMIERACERWGFAIDGWEKDEDGRAQATLGRWRPIEDDEDEGLYADDDGLLTASVVGGVEYGNERVCFWFTPDGMDSGMEVRSPDTLESAD